jgi:hypothetical protein
MDNKMSLEIIQDKWPNILEELRKINLPIYALMRCCKIVDMIENSLSISFPGGLIASKFNEPKTSRLFENVVSEVMGFEVSVKCVTESLRIPFTIFDGPVVYSPRPIVLVPNNDPVNYNEYIISPTWKARARAAKIRADYRCQVCNRQGDNYSLHAHHRTYERLGHELDSDITVLCDDCHKLFSANGKLAKNGARHD